MNNWLNSHIYKRLLVLILALELINMPLFIWLVNSGISSIPFHKALLSSVIFWPGGPAFLLFLGLFLLYSLLGFAKFTPKMRWISTHYISMAAIGFLIYIGVEQLIEDHTVLDTVSMLTMFVNLIISYVLFFYPFLIRDQRKILFESE